MKPKYIVYKYTGTNPLILLYYPNRCYQKSCTTFYSIRLHSDVRTVSTLRTSSTHLFIWKNLMKKKMQLLRTPQDLTSQEIMPPMEVGIFYEALCYWCDYYFIYNRKFYQNYPSPVELQVQSTIFIPKWWVWHVSRDKYLP